MKTAKILAIDTSCDDSSAAVVAGHEVLSNIVASQNQIHKQFGGVFPTMAKQAHKENLLPAIKLAMKQAGVTWDNLEAIAVTAGPGLAPALEVGIAHAKKLAQEYRKPLISINHIEAHALSPLAVPAGRENSEMLGENLPALAVVISGGHSEFILVKKIGQYERLGHTIDDAAGECLDKVGRLLNLGYPAGALIEKFAKKGQLGRFALPKAMTAQANFDLSFSGIKTAARNLIAQLEKQSQLNAQATYNLAATLQETVFTQIAYKLERILLSPDLAQKSYPNRDFLRHLEVGEAPVTPIQEIWLGGGVAANVNLRKILRQTLRQYKKLSGKSISLRVPYSKKLCADNAAMIGLVASYKFAKKEFAAIGKLEREPNLKIS
jgi:N6-L-threonylcarbamoyladenine synthase